MIEWLTTTPNQKYINKTHGADCGQRGWRLHALVVKKGETLADVKVRAALCGLVAAHGWGIDLFIERRCARCEKKAVQARSTT